MLVVKPLGAPSREKHPSLGLPSFESLPNLPVLFLLHDLTPGCTSGFLI